jgi:hypothetical protein
MAKAIHNAAVVAPVVEEAEETKRVIKRVMAEEKVIYDDLEEAKEHRPLGRDAWTLFQVTNSDGTRFIWGPTFERALYWVTIEMDKTYSIVSMDEIPSKTEVAGMFAALSAEDRAALLKELAPQSSKPARK